MKPRIENPAVAAPEVMQALQKLGAATTKAGLRETTLLLVEVRASQINSCSVCLDMHTRELKAAGESDERINRSPPGARRPTSTTLSAPPSR